MDLLQNLEYWHWLLLGVLLALLEIFSPGVFLLWIGIGAAATGLVLLLIPDLAWQVQLVAFALFSIGAIVAAKVFLSAHPLQSDQPALNRRGEQYIGRTFTLQQAVVNGEGKIRVDDSTWKIHGSDCPAGTRVRVVGANGVVLQVEAAD